MQCLLQFYVLAGRILSLDNTLQPFRATPYILGAVSLLCAFVLLRHFGLVTFFVFLHDRLASFRMLPFLVSVRYNSGFTDFPFLVSCTLVQCHTRPDFQLLSFILSALFLLAFCSNIFRFSSSVRHDINGRVVTFVSVDHLMGAALHSTCIYPRTT